MNESDASHRGLSAPFIRRPIATLMLMAGILLVGIIAYGTLPVAALPSVNLPTIQVTAQLPGADPQTMASSVATPLERQFGQIPGLSQMTSASAIGFSQVTLQFDSSRTVDSAASDVQAAINAAGGDLPKTMPTPPTYRKTNPADTPILILALTSKSLPLTTVDDYAESILAQKLSQVSGVGLVTIGGQQQPAMRVEVNPQQLAAQGLTLEDLRTALSSVTVDDPKGTLEGKQQAYALQTDDQLTKIADYNRTIVGYQERRADPRFRYRSCGDRAGERPARRLVQPRSRHHPRGAAPARRQRHQTVDRINRPSCRSSRRRCRRRSRSRWSPTAPRPSAPRSTTCSSRCC